MKRTCSEVGRPAFGDWDLSILKDSPLPVEQGVLQFLFECFNGFNNVNLGSPGSGFRKPVPTCDPSLGWIFATQNDSREIRSALKLLF
jgi:hypothetical protein